MLSLLLIYEKVCVIGIGFEIFVDLIIIWSMLFFFIKCLIFFNKLFLSV